MAEEINILDLNINFGSVVKDTSDLKKTIEELKKELKEAREAGEDTTEEYVKQEAALKNLQRDYRVNSKLIQDLTKASAGNVKTVEEGRRALSAVSTLWAKQAQLYGENDESVQKLAAQKLQLTERLKELESATGDNRRNVGNYTQSILAAFKQTGTLTRGTNQLFQVLRANPFILIIDLVLRLGREIGKAQGIVDAFNAVWQPLFAVFQRIVGLLQSALLPAFQGLMDGTTSLGDVLKDFSKNVLDVLILNRLRALEKAAKAVALVFKGEFREAFDTATDAAAQFVTGIEDLPGKIQRVGAELTEAFEIGQQIDNLRKEIETLEIDFERNEKQRRARVARLRLDAQQENLAIETRIKLLEEAAQIEEQIESERVRLAEKRIEQRRLQLSLNDSDRAAQRELAEIEGQLADAATQRLTRQRELERQSRTLRNQQRAAAREQVREQQRLQQEELNAAAKAAEERIKLFELANKTRLKDGVILTQELIEQETERERQLLKLREDFFQAQLAAGRISEVELQGLLDGLNQQFADFQAGLQERAAVQAIDRLTDAVLDSRRRLREQRIDGLIDEQDIRDQITLLRQLQQDEEDVLTARFEQGLIRESEYRLQLAEIRIRSQEQIARLDIQFEQQEAQREAANFANRIEILRAQGEDELEVRRLQLERQREIELANAEQTGEDIALINAKYAALNEELERQSQQARLQLAANYVTGFAQLIGENTEFGKLAASAAALINTFEAITVALTAPTLPQRIAGVAFATATGFKAVADINSTETPTPPAERSIPKLAKGGIAGGDLHSSGGTKYYGEDGNVVELERGENWYVLNRAASAAINRLSGVNEMFGGRAFSNSPTGYLQDGGLARTSVTDPFDDRPIVVDVKDVISQTARRVRLVDSANV